MYVKKFEDLSKDDLGIAGGKGANLGELTQAGIPVPPGFVVTSKTYDKFMRDTGIFSKVMDILDQVDINNTKELQEAAEKIKAIIIETPIPDGISTYITEAYNQLSERVGEEDGADVAITKILTLFLNLNQNIGKGKENSKQKLNQANLLLNQSILET